MVHIQEVTPGSEHYMNNDQTRSSVFGASARIRWLGSCCFLPATRSARYGCVRRQTINRLFHIWSLY